MAADKFDAQTLFNKAALIDICRRSQVLRHIELDVNGVTEEQLRSLVNLHNSMQMKHMPIIISKILTKYGLMFIADKYPKTKRYLNPEKLKVIVEQDELACLDTTPSKNNLYFVVGKNIICSVFDISIENIDSYLKPFENDFNENVEKIKIAPGTGPEDGPSIGVRDKETPMHFTNLINESFNYSPSSPPVKRPNDESDKTGTFDRTDGSSCNSGSKRKLDQRSERNAFADNDDSSVASKRSKTLSRQDVDKVEVFIKESQNFNNNNNNRQSQDTISSVSHGSSVAPSQSASQMYYYDKPQIPERSDDNSRHDADSELIVVETKNGLSFKKNSDPIEFLERVDRFAQQPEPEYIVSTYEFSDDLDYSDVRFDTVRSPSVDCIDENIQFE